MKLIKWFKALRLNASIRHNARKMQRINKRVQRSSHSRNRSNLGHVIPISICLENSSYRYIKKMYGDKLQERTIIELAMEEDDDLFWDADYWW